MGDTAAVLYCCIVPLLCPPSKPMAIQTIQWRAVKSVLYGGRSSQAGLEQVKLPNPGVTLATVEKTKGWSLEPGTLFPALPLMPA